MRKRPRQIGPATSIGQISVRTLSLTLALTLALVLGIAGGHPAAAHGPIDEEIHRAGAEVAAAPTDAAAVLRRAELHRLHRDWDAARIDYARSEALAPHLAAIALARGAMELEAGEPEAAAADLRRYLRDRRDDGPDDGFARFLLGRALGDQGQIEAAVEEMDAAIARMPRPETEHFLARARLCAAASHRGFERALSGLELARERMGLVPTRRRSRATPGAASPLRRRARLGNRGERCARSVRGLVARR